MEYKKHLIIINTTIKNALESISKVGIETILFAVNENNKLVGSITDGDIRRGLLNGQSLDDEIINIINREPKYIRKENYSINEIVELRSKNYKVIPIINKDDVIINILNFRLMKSYLPIDVVIMAGGLGSRLKPLTDKTPKPLLKVGEKTIIDYNIDRLIKFGIDDFWITVNYLGHLIKKHLGNGDDRNINIKYVDEEVPLGTIGSVSKINNFKHDYVLVTNSDILTNLDYEKFFQNFLENDADMSVVTIPYRVDIPYAVVQTDLNKVKSFIEKPSYTYFSNGGIYLIKKSILKYIPKNLFYNSTDLMELLIEKNLNLISFPLHDYWIDIGNHKDYKKAQNDHKQIKF